ncbi:uncharacterized protein GGS22DRAFT_137827 [Annulohypoxylon maeteangense]|uniref:uncharacterized protein n=1 Tax=Annulohypoxylon maeteangense TaxID=1927788 RepID=UPI0020081F1E|nr:uncharacterized protein GGS22DRAFT_137827 [Annulohypoxylon maeteangense]KAI0885050.1 hypothetical protein GGS22DRAFT_137827 [Annulohypoxylon maeteangense]
MLLKPSPSFVPLPTGITRTELMSKIEIYHPGYSQPTCLASFNASDPGGLYYLLVYWACCIIADNIWEDDEGFGENGEITGPYLSKSSSPGNPLSRTELLPIGRYYFHVPGYTNDPPFPISCNFDNWEFPDKLPLPWEQLRTSIDSFADQSDSHSAYDSDLQPCCITAGLTSLEKCHVMPPSTKRWLKNNDMRRFLDAQKVRATHDAPGNKIFIRKDIHFLWDQNHLTMLPKLDSSPDTPEYRLTTHVLHPPGKSADSDMEILALYQNIPCLPLRKVPIEFLFARFAWSIFTNFVIMLFNDDDDEGVYSISLRTPNGRVAKQLSVHEIPPLFSKATGTRGASTSAWAGQKRGFDEVTHDDAANLLYSFQTGQMEPVLDEHEPGDRWSDYFSDDERPYKRSRSCSSDTDDGTDDADDESEGEGEGEGENGDSSDDTAGRFSSLPLNGNVKNNVYVHHDDTHDDRSSSGTSSPGELWPDHAPRHFSPVSGNARARNAQIDSKLY